MITTLADVLRALQDAEAKRLQAQGITHGPTIGAMYEGLTKDILERAIPSGLDLKVVSGFIEGVEGVPLSGQVDLMLVRGEGRQIPYTDNYIWPVEDVLVVFEVKKTLSGVEMADAFSKMWKVSHLAQEFRKADGYIDKDLSFARKTFARLTGYHPRPSEVYLFPEALQIIHFCTVAESLFPVRVILGYEGYKSEEGLRKGADKVLFDDRARGSSRGFLSLPSLVMCGSSCLVKLNGFPYFNRYVDFSNTWNVMASSSDNPTKILLELVWTKISSEANLGFPMDDTLQQERMSLLFRFKYFEVVIDGKKQSGFGAESFANIKLTRDRPLETWRPEAANELHAIVLLKVFELGFLDLHDEWFMKLCAAHMVNPEVVLSELIEKRTLAWVNTEKTRAEPIELDNLITLMPDGDVAISSNHSLMNLWLRQKDV